MNLFFLNIIRSHFLILLCLHKKIRPVIFIVGAAALLLLSVTTNASDNHDHDDHHEEQTEKGTHNGRLLEADNFVVELAIFERGVPPEFRAWANVDGKQLEPANWQLQVQLTRLGGKIDSFEFSSEQEFLRSPTEVEEPHSFDVSVTATYKGKRYEWRYPSHEGRLVMSAETAKASGVTTSVAGAGKLKEQITLYGDVVADPERISHIQARYPGLLRNVNVKIGDRVTKNQILAVVESNESVREYSVLAPIDGIVIARHANVGEFSGERSLFTVVDYQQLEFHLQIFPRNVHQIAVDQIVTVYAGGSLGEHAIDRQTTTRIEYITPHEAAAPTLVAHGSVDNSAGLWTPNQAVEALVTAGDIQVPLMIDNRALQTFRDWDVVFIQVGDTYEIRPLTLGRSDGTHTEVLAGLNVGDAYVVDNSYLLKADLEKSGAAHDH